MNILEENRQWMVLVIIVSILIISSIIFASQLLDSPGDAVEGDGKIYTGVEVDFENDSYNISVFNDYGGHLIEFSDFYIVGVGDNCKKLDSQVYTNISANKLAEKSTVLQSDQPPKLIVIYSSDFNRTDINFEVHNVIINSTDEGYTTDIYLVSTNNPDEYDPFPEEFESSDCQLEALITN